MKVYEIVGRRIISETVKRRSIGQEVSIERCLDILKETKYPDRNRAMFYLREMMRLKDVAGLRTIGDVIGRDGEFHSFIVAIDGDIIILDDRAKGLIATYLMKRFRRPLNSIAPNEPLFPTEKNPAGAKISSLPAHFWAIDGVIKKALAAEKEGDLAGDDALFAKKDAGQGLGK
jgi:hypothetical protein